MFLAKNWWMFLLRGILALAFGLFALFRPGLTVALLVWVFGIFMLVEGIIAIVSAFTSNAKSEHWWFIILGGVLGVILGVMTLANPYAMGFAWIYLISIWAIVTGIFEIFTAIKLRKEIEGEIWMIIGGLFSVIFGLLVLFNPLAGGIAIGFIIGIFAVLFGIIFIAFSISLKRHGDVAVEDSALGGMASTVVSADVPEVDVAEEAEDVIPAEEAQTDGSDEPETEKGK